MRIFLAGASGAIGRRLTPLLVAAGHEVTGTTRSAAKAEFLRAAGATAVGVDVFDADALTKAVAAARPDVIIHQLTDLPQVPDPARQAEVQAANARLRIEGTRNLMAAARAAGVGRVIAQSIAFVYAPGQGARLESDPLDLGTGKPSVSVTGVIALEESVLGTPGIDGQVLRYGRLYGPGTWREPPAPRPDPPALHVDAAAEAARLAVTRGQPGIYNIAEDDGAVSIAKAVRELGFDHTFRMPSA